MYKIIEVSANKFVYGTATLSPSDMKHLNLKNNDIIKLTGKRITTAKVIANDNQNDGTIELNGIIRQNCKATIGDEINVQKENTILADEITIVPSSECQDLFINKDNDSSKIKQILKRMINLNNDNCIDILKYQRLMNGVPVVVGDKIKVQLFGRSFDFNVLETKPEGIVVIDENTNVNILGGSKIKETSTTFAYDDIGGLKKEVARVREMVELPLRCPKIFEKLGIEAPKGLLLYGPPGCGKTLIARAVAQETGVHFISVNSAEIIQQDYGASEQQLRNIFEEAERYPATIIFFDEIDALAPNRENVLGEVEKRVVSQLLTLMDGLKNRGQIVVIAATNLPNMLDPALRRPGRFDREIEIHAPNKEGRIEILKIHTRGMPLDEKVNLEEIADKTPGFVGADLAALTREAAMASIRNLPYKRISPYSIEPDIENIKITMKDFYKALSEVELSTTREISTEVPTIHWTDIGGQNEIKSILKDTIELPLKYEEEFKAAKIIAPQGILLTGKSGTGKTMLANALATETDVNFISVKGPELLSKWVGDSEKSIRKVFKKARQSAPSIIFFDEIDAIVPERKNDEGSGHIGERMVGQFLVEMDNTKNQNVLIIGATNRPDLIDKALLRPGRFDYVLELKMPQREERLEILQIYTKNRKLADDVSLENLANETNNCTGADLEMLCRMAIMNAVKEAIKNNLSIKDMKIENKHFEQSLRCILK